MGASGKVTWSADIWPTPTQMFEGIQFHCEFGETTTTSWCLAQLAPQVQCGGVAGNAGTKDDDACHQASWSNRLLAIHLRASGRWSWRAGGGQGERRRAMGAVVIAT